MISGRFIKSSLLYTIGGAMPMASGLVLLPFYTDLLTVGDYGLLMLYITFSLFMQVLTTYSLDAYVGVHYVDVKEDKAAAKKLISAVAGLLLVLGGVFIPLFWWIGEPLFDASFNRTGNLDFFPWGIMSVAVGFFNGFFKTATSLLIYRQEAMKYLLFNVFNFVLTIVISLVGLYMYPGELTGPMYGRLLSGVGIFLMALFFLWRNYGISFSFKDLTGLHKFCFPYLIYLVLVWIVSNVDRYIINDALNSEYVGIYDFALRCTLLIDLLQNGLSSAVYPVVFGMWKDHGKDEVTKETNRYFNVFTAASVLFAAGFSVVIPLFIPLVVKNVTYYESFMLMAVMASGFGFRGIYHYFLAPVLYQKRTKVLPLAFGLSALVQVPLTYFLTQQYSLEGAVWANVIMKVVQSFFLWTVARSTFSFSFNPMKLIVLPLVFSAGVIVLWYSLDAYTWWWYLVAAGATGAVIFVFYQQEIRITLEKFLKKRSA